MLPNSYAQSIINIIFIDSYEYKQHNACISVDFSCLIMCESAVISLIIIKSWIMADNPVCRSAETTERSHHLAPLKQTILDRYFIAQQQFDQQFVAMIFSLAEHDAQVDALIREQSITILLSKQKAALSFLEHLIASHQYQQIASQFLLDVIDLKITIYNQPLLLYVLAKMPLFLVFLNKRNPQFIQSLLTFLAFKMRSFDLQTRVIALQTMKEVGKPASDEWDKALRRIVPLMIEKEQLVKQVSYIKGLFLQMLQDQFHQVRMLSIQCLGIFRNYLRAEDLKQIIIYMLNDQHELVREQALQTAKQLKNLPLAKQDLQTLLMCLKEKRTNLRRLVYQNLAVISITDVSLILILLEKILVALQNYRSDKKHIYRTLYQLGCNYHQQIGRLFPNLGLNEAEQPNFKNISYKAKMVLCHHWWKKRQFQADNISLPLYFTKHMLYITDVQAYLFQQSGYIQEEVESTVDFTSLNSNFHHLVRFIECEEDISQQFHKTLLEVAREWIINHTEVHLLSQKLKMLEISFNLGPPEQQLKSDLQKIIQQPPKSSHGIIQHIKLIISNREKFELDNISVPVNKCTISRLQPNLVLSSKCASFIDHAFLKCWKHPMVSKDRKIQYKKVNELELLNQNKESCFWRANLSRYSQVQCILALSNGQEKVLDSYDIDQK